MRLDHALRLIKKALKEYKEIWHFKEQAVARGFCSKEIREILQGEIVGITLQGGYKYHVCFRHTQTKDLNIILEIQNNRRLKFITLFPSEIERRKK